MPSADFCHPVCTNLLMLSPVSKTSDRPPEVSPTTFRAQPPDLQPVPLMDMGFAVTCHLARHRMPLIRFLSIGSRFCFRASFRPTVAGTPLRFAALHLDQVGTGTFSPLVVEHARHTKECGDESPNSKGRGL